MALDADTVQQVRARLRVSTAVNDERIELARQGQQLVLQGAVATPEEASIALELAEEVAGDVIDDLRVDPDLRSETEDLLDGEPAGAYDDEELIGSVDMLAGPDATFTEDLADALDNNEPWIPPDVESAAPTRLEERMAHGDTRWDSTSSWQTSPDTPRSLGGDDARAPASLGRAASDLSAADLDAEAHGASPPEFVAGAGNESFDDSTALPPRESGTWADDMVTQVPGTARGSGAMSEAAQDGGAWGGTAAVETGAVGLDTAAADPARNTPQRDAATDRGPESRDDAGVRDQFPSTA